MLTRIKIRSKVVTGHFSSNGSLDRDHPTRRDALATVHPIRNMRLPDTKVLGQSCLSASNLDGSQQGLGLGNNGGTDASASEGSRHMPPEYNTQSVMSVNTQSVIDASQNRRMPRTGQTSDFWRRLIEARQEAGLPILQDEIAKSFGKRQSAVTKWKTGKSLPETKVLIRMADSVNVNIDWLLRGKQPKRPADSLHPITERITSILEKLNDAHKTSLFEQAINLQIIETPAIAARLNEVKAEHLKHLNPPKQQQPLRHKGRS